MGQWVPMLALALLMPCRLEHYIPCLLCPGRTKTWVDVMRGYARRERKASVFGKNENTARPISFACRSWCMFWLFAWGSCMLCMGTDGSRQVHGGPIFSLFLHFMYSTPTPPSYIARFIHEWNPTGLSIGSLFN